MGLRFLHTADWQLGKAFGQMPDGLSGRLQAARIDAVERIRDLAAERGIAHVIVAGDVWDVEQPRPDALVQPMDLMGANADVQWWLMPGNHDPARAHGLWSRLETPDNVHCLLSPQAVEMEPGAFILPAPWMSKRPGRDLSRDFASMDTPEGSLRIGVAHGSTAEFAGEAPQSARIDTAIVEAARLDYLALGDWHGMNAVAPRAWYAGTPEPDRFPRNDPGYVLEVDVQADGPPAVTPHKVGTYAWVRANVVAEPGVDPQAQVEAALAGGDARRTLLRLELSGSLAREELEALNAYLEGLRGRVAHLRLRGAVHARIAEDDLDRLDLAGEVRAVAERLRAQAEGNGDGDGDADARLALDTLFDISASLETSA